MMLESIKEELQQETMSDFHQKLSSKCVELVRESRDEMSRYYDNWDEQARIYESHRPEDKTDRQAHKNKEPRKMVVPLSTAQVNTFVAAMFLLFTQRQKFFELEPTGPEDSEIRQASEDLLQRDLKYNRFSVCLFQFLLDIGRFGVGIFKHGWVEEKIHVNVPLTEEQNGVNVSGEYGFQEFTEFEGNKIQTISPYRFFPDMRLPLTRFQEGEFCASEDELPMIKLKEFESFGMAAGVEHVVPMSTEQLSRRTNTRFSSINAKEPTKTPDVVLITEIQLKLIPADFELDDGSKLGEEEFPVTYLVWIANDERIIRLEPANNFHSKFTYDVAQFTPDQHKQLSKSLSGMVAMLQETIDWFINARVTSVKRTLDNQLVVDPTGVDMRTIENRSRVIKLRQSVGRGGVDRYVKQLPVNDVTARHMDDANQLMGIMQMVTGVNDAALGQAQTGRRSATEMRAVNQGAASRLILEGKLIWDQAIAPAGEKMLLNSRQNLTMEGFLGALGESEEKVVLYAAYTGDATKLIGKHDFFVFDGTLPTEKVFLAQSLQELAQVLIQSGLILEMGIDIKKMIKEIYELRGVTDLERFMLSPEEQQLMMRQQQMNQAQQNGGTTNNQPGQQQPASGAGGTPV